MHPLQLCSVRRGELAVSAQLHSCSLRHTLHHPTICPCVVIWRAGKRYAPVCDASDISQWHRLCFAGDRLISLSDAITTPSNNTQRYKQYVYLRLQRSLRHQCTVSSMVWVRRAQMFEWECRWVCICYIYLVTTCTQDLRLCCPACLVSVST